MMTTVANRIDVRKLSLSTQKALHQRVIEAYKKGIKRTQIAKTFGMSRRWVWKVLRAFEKHGEEAAIAGHSRGARPCATSSADANRVWARVYPGKSKYGKRSVESDYTAFQFGYDRQVHPGLWAGAALSFTDGSNDFAFGSGDSSIAALTGYVTKLFDNGAFLDGTLKSTTSSTSRPMRATSRETMTPICSPSPLKQGTVSIPSTPSSSSRRSNSCTVGLKASTTRRPPTTA